MAESDDWASSFLRLPKDIRDAIYSEVIASGHTDRLTYTTSSIDKRL